MNAAFDSIQPSPETTGNVAVTISSRKVSHLRIFLLSKMSEGKLRAQVFKETFWFNENDNARSEHTLCFCYIK